MNKCFFILHQYKPAEVFGTGHSDIIGVECRRCGSRKLDSSLTWSVQPEVTRKALNWLKEEVIK